MGMTILMDNSKYLKITQDCVLYQGENYVDSFYIILPLYYGEQNLSEYTIAMEYTDMNENSYIDILEQEEEIYKENYIRCKLPITTKLTKSVGEIKIQLTLNKVDKTKLIQYTLHSSELILEVHKYADYYKFSDESLQKIDTLIGKLDTKLSYLETAATALSTKIPNDLGFDEEGTLKISINQELVGNGVNVGVVEQPDSEDEETDGIINITGQYEEVEL